MDDECANDKNNEKDKKKNPHKSLEARNSLETNEFDVSKPWILQNNNNVNQPSAYKSECNGIAAEENTISLNDCAYGKAITSRAGENCSKQQETVNCQEEEAIKRINGFCNGIKMNHSKNDANSADNETLKSDEDDINESDSNSTDNLSFISEEIVDNGIINEIILLPNNLISEDELSTNSDDCVYAYRGADFDPVPENTEDENDFLEMDFEPDPASEIEQENNVLAISERNVPPLVERSPNALRDNDEHELSQQRKIVESSKITCEQNNDWKKQTDTLLNINWKDDGGKGVTNGMDTTSRSNKLESNPIAARKNTCSKNIAMENVEKSGASYPTASTSTFAPEECYYDQTISLSSKRYTGTIPKTSRSSSIIRPNRTARNSSVSKPSNDNQTNNGTDCTEDNHNTSNLWASRNRDACKRWKINEDENDCVTASVSFREPNPSIVFGPSCSNREEYRTEANCMPSTSFAAEQRPIRTQEGRSCGNNSNSNDIFSVHSHKLSDRNRTASESGEMCMNHTTDTTDYQQLNDGIFSTNEDYDTSFVHDTVTIYSIDCTIDIIIKALVSTYQKFTVLDKSIKFIFFSLLLQSKLNIEPDLDVLRQEMPHFRYSPSDSAVGLAMNIPEYLVYMSKLNCNYKAIISAIKLACRTQELDIKFFPVNN